MRAFELLIIQSENKRLDYVENISKLGIYLLTKIDEIQNNFLFLILGKSWETLKQTKATKS